MQNDNLLRMLASIGVGAATGAVAYYSMRRNNNNPEEKAVEKTVQKHTGKPIPTMNFF